MTSRPATTTTRRRSTRARVLAVTPALAAATIAGLVTAGPAHAAAPSPVGKATVALTTSAYASGSLAITGAAASFAAVRSGWGATSTIAVQDTKADGRCAYVKVAVAVAHGDDVSTRVSACGNGVVRRASDVRLSAGAGTSIPSVKMQVCTQVNNLPDSCSGWTSRTLPGMAPLHPERWSTANYYLNGVTLSRFWQIRATRPGGFEWSEDGCSAPAGGAGFNAVFYKACVRHDFGYRNFGNYRFGNAINRVDAQKQAVDSRFYYDMMGICANARPSGVAYGTCTSMASIFYSAVSLKGGSAFYGY